MVELDVRTALEPWGITRAAVAPTAWGINNSSWFIDSSSGRHVLRVYTSASPGEVSSEHALLSALASAGLPFRTPTAIHTKAGATVASVDTPRGRRTAALYERIDGDHLDDADVAGIEAAGAAFAELDRALAGIDVERPSFDTRMDAVHPMVPDLEDLGEVGAPAAGFVRRMARAPAELRGSLRPRQLIHDDFALGNVLIRHGRVVGILDFEFAAHEARAVELAIALRLVLSKSSRESSWRPLLRGYLRRSPLGAAEIEALPTLALHQEAVVLVWWLGRYRSGDADRRSLDEHIARTLRLEPWITANAQAVIAEGRSIRAGTGR